jgi:hypothetical protein
VHAEQRAARERRTEREADREAGAEQGHAAGALGGGVTSAHVGGGDREVRGEDAGEQRAANASMLLRPRAAR